MRVWQDDAKCRDMDPCLFDEESVVGDPAEYARKLCAGCPVIAECGAEASRPIRMDRIVGGFGGVDREPDATPIFQSGVVRAGVVGETRLSFPCLNDANGVPDPDAGWAGDLRGDSEWCPCKSCVQEREHDLRVAGNES